MAEDYQVGYRKPPKRMRFKPGQSGNVEGRRTDMETDVGVGILEEKAVGRRKAGDVRAFNDTVGVLALQGVDLYDAEPDRRHRIVRDLHTKNSRCR